MIGCEDIMQHAFVLPDLPNKTVNHILTVNAELRHCSCCSDELTTSYEELHYCNNAGEISVYGEGMWG